MPKGERLEVDGVDVVAQVHAVLDRMAAFADRVRGGQWTGHPGKRIRNVVSIGIGGSDLGPVMACEALRDFRDRDMPLAFASTVDGTAFSAALRGLEPAAPPSIVSTTPHPQPQNHGPEAADRARGRAGVGGERGTR